jgi:hypothetical protein
MGVDKIIKLVGVLVALVAGVIGGFAYSAVLIAVLGLAGGWFIEKDDRMRFLVATIALIEVQGFLAEMAELGQVGGYVTAALGGLAALFTAAAVMVILVGTVEAVKP